MSCMSGVSRVYDGTCVPVTCYLCGAPCVDDG